MTRACGWSKPTPLKLARCRAGAVADSVLADIEAAESSDLRHLVRIVDQGALGSCTANAVGQIIRGAQVRAGSADPPFPSRLFAYYLARAEDGNADRDAGSYVCTVLDATARIGFCPESAWEYSDGPEKFAWMPSMDSFRLAFDQRGRVGVNYHQLQASGEARLDLVRRALTAGYLVAFGTLVSEALCNGNLGAGPIPPPIGQPIAGGHAMTICGHGPGHFEIANSWGTGFGDSGFCRFAPEYVAWNETDDLWLVSLSIPYAEAA